MKRITAYRILGKMEASATPEQKEALDIAQRDIEFVDLMPKDMVAVIRCKDCVYNANGCCTHSENYDDTRYRPDYFCADAEPKARDEE